MARIIKITVPVPPSINHCYFYIKGRRIKSNKARDFDKEVISITNKVGYKFPPRTKIICDMNFYFKDKRKRDTHNTLKLLFDAIETGGLYENDMYVLPRVLDFCVDRILIEIEQYKAYIRDASTMYKPIDHPKNLSNKGSKILYRRSPFESN